MLSFYAINHCSFISLSICFLMKLMIVLFLMLIVDLFHVTSLINWFTALFSMMFLQLDTHCMQIWHRFCCRLIRFCRMLLNNFKLILLFAFNLCSVIWLSVYTQISLSLDAFSLHIAIASSIAYNFTFVMIISLITLVALLHLTDSCVNIIMILISVLNFAIFFQVCDASMYITIFFVFLTIVFSRLIVKLSFHIYILIQLDYLNWIFWLNLITRVESSDSTWYWSWVRIRFKFSTQLIKQLNMTSRELNIEIFPIFRLCIIFLHYFFGRKL